MFFNKNNDERLLMQKKTKKVFALAVAGVLAFSVPCYANTTDDEIASVTIINENTQQDLIDVQERLAALEEQKGNTENYLSELSAQLSDLSLGLDELQKNYEGKLQEIEIIQQELAVSRENEQTQYENMKLRIQYIYEESVNNNALESLFSAGSFADFLNRAEQISELNKYDREMLVSYNNIVKEIEEKEQRLLQEKADIEQIQQQMQEQQNAITVIYEDSYRELEACLIEIQNSENAQSELVEQIRQQEELLDSLAAKKFAEEEEARRQKEAEEAAMREAAEQANQAAIEAQKQQEAASQPQTPETSGTTEAVETPSAPSTPSTDNSTSGNMTYLGNFTLTAYCSCAKCCGKWAQYAGLTASGAYCQEGVTVAMGGVPFGTKLSINGHIYTVQDRGTPYGHVDIYFASHEAACAFGLQYADVYQVN